MASADDEAIRPPINFFYSHFHDSIRAELNVLDASVSSLEPASEQELLPRLQQLKERYRFLEQIYKYHSSVEDEVRPRAGLVPQALCRAPGLLWRQCRPHTAPVLSCCADWWRRWCTPRSMPRSRTSRSRTRSSIRTRCGVRRTTGVRCRSRLPTERRHAHQLCCAACPACPTTDAFRRRSCCSSSCQSC
jgi:hypothetical protein